MLLLTHVLLVICVPTSIMSARQLWSVVFFIVIARYQWFLDMILSPENIHSNPQVPESTTNLTDLSTISSNHREPALNLGIKIAYKIFRELSHLNKQF